MKRGPWPIGEIGEADKERARVRVLYRTEKAPSGCWEWRGCQNGHGYAKVVAFGRLWQGHRLMWFIDRGEIPDGMDVLHHCDNRGCINPEHLFLGTDRDNQEDRLTKMGYESPKREEVRRIEWQLPDRRPVKYEAGDIERLAELRSDGWTLEQLAKGTGLSIGTIAKLSKQGGYAGEANRRGGYRKWKPEYTKQGLDLLRQGYNYREVAEKLDVNMGTLYAYTRKHLEEGVAVRKYKSRKKVAVAETSTPGEAKVDAAVNEDEPVIKAENAREERLRKAAEVKAKLAEMRDGRPFAPFDE